MSASQDKIFTTSEGDNWFARNREALGRFDPASDVPLRLIELYSLRPERVLEVGAANGFRLAAISDRTGATCVAVEPSGDAIEDGRSRYPNIEFVQGEASALPLSGAFDLVIVNFVLHWIDRTTIMQSAAELDRMIRDGGLLLLGDFFVGNRACVPYHHLPGQQVFTYKQNYASMFLESGLYTQIAFLSADHASRRLDSEVADHDRVGFFLLKKSLHANYVGGTSSQQP